MATTIVTIMRVIRLTAMTTRTATIVNPEVALIAAMTIARTKKVVQVVAITIPTKIVVSPLAAGAMIMGMKITAASAAEIYRIYWSKSSGCLLDENRLN